MKMETAFAVTASMREHPGIRVAASSPKDLGMAPTMGPLSLPGTPGKPAIPKLRLRLPPGKEGTAKTLDS